MTSSTNGANSSATPPPEPPMDDSMMPGATRQLPPIEPYASKPGKHIIFGVNSDIGVVRTNNQDAIYAMYSVNLSVDSAPDFGLFVVADGMGGHHDGEKASALTTRIIAKYINEEFFLKLLYSQDDDSPIISEVLNDAVLKANQMVGEKVPEGGTTCTAAIILGDLAYIAHVGDSRAYLISVDGIEQITRDHSLVQRLIELDQLTQEEAANHPQRNVLYRALGQNESIDVDTITRRLPPGAYLMLCSDGLWNHLSEAQIIQLVRAAKSPQEACDSLVAKANERGGLDNISVIVVQIPG
ncbi:MAG: Stp1/IreP family PP2C-type Ser/Thr phosphatase [Anaerolineae bacterium]|nr:Stp1/IreP family PP2C-type Ser/Thr phosphatase [Anaerolineae bacterium]